MNTAVNVLIIIALLEAFILMILAILLVVKAYSDDSSEIKSRDIDKMPFNKILGGTSNDEEERDVVECPKCRAQKGISLLGDLKGYEDYEDEGD